MPRRCWLHTRAALLGHQIQNFYSSWALLNEFFTEWAVFQQLSHHQACSEQKNNTFKALQSVCWIQSWLYSSEYKGGLKVVLTLILAGPSPKAAFPCSINGFIEAFAQCVAGTLMNNTQTLKGAKRNFCSPLLHTPRGRAQELMQFPGMFVHKARTHLVLISARSRTTAITGVEPSPVAGSEVWIERLPSWGSNMDWTACTTFSVMDSLWRGNAWWWGGTVKS